MEDTRKLSDILYDASKKETFEEDTSIAKHFKENEKDLRKYVKEEVKSNSPLAAKYYNDLISRFVSIHDKKTIPKSFRCSSALFNHFPDAETLKIYFSIGTITAVLALTGLLAYYGTKYIDALNKHTEEIKKEINYIPPKLNQNK